MRLETPKTYKKERQEMTRPLGESLHDNGTGDTIRYAYQESDPTATVPSETTNQLNTQKHLEEKVRDNGCYS